MATFDENNHWKSRLLQLPNAVILRILGLLLPEELSQVVRSSRELHRLAASPILWERFYLCFWKEEKQHRAEFKLLSDWRDANRIGYLRKVAKAVWLKNRDATKDSEDAPFPLFLSSRSASAIPKLLEQPNFYKLFCERMRIDQAVLQIIRKACLYPADWPVKMQAIVKEYENEAKDVLVALITTQERLDEQIGIFIESKSDGTLEDVLGFPSALQVRKPTTSRSKSHHLVLLHFGEELLSYLRHEQAFCGIERLRLKLWQMEEVEENYQFSWTEFSSTQHISENQVPLNLKTAKRTENGLTLLSMLNSGEGYEIVNELDMLAVSCSLFLRKEGLCHGSRNTARGIYNFMLQNGFRCAKGKDALQLNKSFLHFSLDESGRECQALIFAVIFSSISWRVGLSAIPAFTPIGPMLAIHNSDSPRQGYSNNFYWLSILEKGIVYQTHQIKNKFKIGQLIYRFHGMARVYAMAPLECCLEMIYYVQRSCNEHAEPALGSTYVKSDTIQVTVVGQDASFRGYIHLQLQSILLENGNAFNPRTTSYNTYDRQIYLNSSVYPAPVHLPRPILRSLQSGKRLTSAGRHLQVFTRLPDLSQCNSTFKEVEDLIKDTSGSFDWKFFLSSSKQKTTLDFLQPKFRRGTVRYVQEGRHRNEIPYQIGTIVVHWKDGFAAVILDCHENIMCQYSRNRLAMDIHLKEKKDIGQLFYDVISANGSVVLVAHEDIYPAAASLPMFDGRNTSSKSAHKANLSSRQIENLLRARPFGYTFRCVATQSNGSGLRLVGKLGHLGFPPKQEYEGTPHFYRQDQRNEDEQHLNLEVRQNQEFDRFTADNFDYESMSTFPKQIFDQHFANFDLSQLRSALNATSEHESMYKEASRSTCTPF